MDAVLAALSTLLGGVALLVVGVSRALDAMGEFSRDPR